MPRSRGESSGYVGCRADGDLGFQAFLKGVHSAASDSLRDAILQDRDHWGPVSSPAEHSRAQVRSCLTRRNRLTKVAHGSQLGKPLHCKKVQPMHLARLLNDMSPRVAQRIRTLLADLGRSPAQQGEVSARFRVPTGDLELLKSADVVEAFSATGGTPVRYFTVYEAVKERRRPIMWPWTFLLCSDYTSQFSLNEVGTYCQAVHKGNNACAFDLASSFWQVLLESCNFVLVDENGNKWRIKRMPFGVDCASEIMQLIVEELGRMARVHAGLRDDEVSLYVHIDNIMCVGSCSLTAVRSMLVNDVKRRISTGRLVAVLLCKNSLLLCCHLEMLPRHAAHTSCLCEHVFPALVPTRRSLGRNRKSHDFFAFFRVDLRHASLRGRCTTCNNGFVF